MAVAQALSESHAAAGSTSNYDPALVPPYTASESPSTPRANLRDGSTPMRKSGTSSKSKGKRSVPVDDDDDDDEDEVGQERTSARPEGVGQDIPGLPEWPLPPKGPRSRKTMPRDEMLARRRARNRVAGKYLGIYLTALR
jgi:hypothetical protein